MRPTRPQMFLTYVSFEKRKSRDGRIRRFYTYECPCGRVFKTFRSRVQSCGCGRHIPTNKTHGYAGKNKKRGSTYSSWEAMKSRCLNPNHQAYSSYGGRGITICNEWLDFKGFLKDMGERPKGMTLDRIDNDKGYSKSNCRWSTPKQQARNRRNAKNK